MAAPTIIHLKLTTFFYCFQLIFFMMCDRVLLCGYDITDCPHKKATGLYSLMFYNVIAYCVNYIKELIEKEDWSPYVNMTHHSNIKHLAMSATKIVLEWTKAVTFIITVTFMLLVFGLEQGLQNYQPTALYTALTWIYYMSTEKVFVEMFPALLTFLRLEQLEALENLYAPVLLRGYTILVSGIFVIALVCLGNLRFALISFYVNVFLRAKDAAMNCYKDLKNEQAVLAQFRYATDEELKEWDDICAVCLSSMVRARVTPCHHLFHSDCLRLCLNASTQCPMCKREYMFL